MNIKYMHGIYYFCIAHSDVHQDLDGFDIVSGRPLFVFILTGLVYVCPIMTRAAVFPRLPPFLSNND